MTLFLAPLSCISTSLPLSYKGAVPLFVSPPGSETPPGTFVINAKCRYDVFIHWRFKFCCICYKSVSFFVYFTTLLIYYRFNEKGWQFFLPLIMELLCLQLLIISAIVDDVELCCLQFWSYNMSDCGFY